MKSIKEKMFTPEVQDALNLALTDGGAIYIDTDAETPAVGDNVFTDAEMTEAVAAGDYDTDAGLIVVGEDGAITEIKTANEDEMKKELEEKIKQLEAEMKKTADEAKESKEYKDKYKALKKANEETAPPGPVDYSAMGHDGDNHFMDEGAKELIRKYK